MSWDTQFTKLYQHCVEQYRGGNEDFMSHYSEEDLAFLESIGYKPRELFDFVEDFVDQQTPAPTTALLIAAVRRDYFQVVQGGKHSEKEITTDDLPTFGDELEGMAYLPRIITKAEAKLRGELDPDLMYGCGGDRRFLSTHGDLHPADFLRHVWSADGDHSEIAAWVKQQQK